MNYLILDLLDIFIKKADLKALDLKKIVFGGIQKIQILIILLKITYFQSFKEFCFHFKRINNCLIFISLDKKLFDEEFLFIQEDIFNLFD